MVDVSKLNAPECKTAQKEMGAASLAFTGEMSSGKIPSADAMTKLKDAQNSLKNACGGLDSGCTQMLNQLSAGQIAGTAPINDVLKPMVNACTTTGTMRPARAARTPRPERD